MFLFLNFVLSFVPLSEIWKLASMMSWMNSLTCLLNIYLCKSHFYLCKFHQKHPKVINKTRSFLHFWEGTSPSDTLVPTGAEVLSALDLVAPSFKKSWIRSWFLRWLRHMYSHRWLWSFLDWCACLTECLFLCGQPKFWTLPTGTNTRGFFFFFFQDVKQLYALVCQTLKYSSVLEQIMNAAGLLQHEKWLKEPVARCMTYDLLFGKGVK